MLNTTGAGLLSTGILSAPVSSSASGDPGDFIPGTCVRRHQAASEPMRDRILQTAHQMYSSNARNPVLIEMLLTLHDLHPQHLPTLLLLACAYFSSSQPAKSLEYNKLILKIDPNYVEAMSNIGTTLRSMGKATEAEVWWWRAVKLRPGYWDAVENLMGVLCNPGASAREGSDEKAKATPRYREALELCEFVDRSLCTGTTGTVRTYQVQEKQLYRLQSLLYSEGNLRFALGDVAGARREYEKAMEAVLGGNTLNDVIVRIASAGAQEGINQMFHQQLHNTQPPAHGLTIDRLPLTLLAPENAVRILQVIFPESRGVLPGFVALATRSSDSAQLQQANQVASNLLLTLAKLHQDHAVVAQPLSIVLPLYYMALALVPSPSTCNNLGIILSAIPSPSTATMVPSLQGGHQAAQAPMGSALAMQYYTHGLTLDSRHPHLYTNLGSLLKDLGYLAEAVRMYEQAVKYNDTFDVALANLGNAIKDMGRVQDSIQWYLKAVRASPNFVEAVCGLANAMAGVCDWRARDGLYTEISMISYAQAPASPHDSGTVDMRRGWMDRVVEIVDQQLSDGRQWARGLLRMSGPVSPLARFLHNALSLARAVSDATELPEATKRRWRYFVRQLRNEGGWAMRLAERAMVELQRRWYWDVQRHVPAALDALQSPQSSAYQRPRLPTGMVAPLVPTVLPFHTFTYPLDAREIRLISHRNAMRLSFTTLGGSAPWLPAHVYAPPPPPDPHIRIGYVSSDFNNHPLSHLMQSVFGMHDRSRFRVYCYATTPPDGTAHRQKIEAEADVFLNCAAWSTQRIVEQIARDQIHVLVNLNGYTKGARNEIFAARPAPVLVAFMGFAGTLGAGWCDYVVTDPIVCPPWTVRSEVRAERRRRALKHRQQPEMQERERQRQRRADEAGVNSWVYTERMIYMPHTYFVNDHRQGFREDEELREVQSAEELWMAEQDARYKMRRELFPQLSDDVFIFANFNQLYKIDPTLFRLWLRILERVPNAIVWLLRFPAAGEEHLHRVAKEWAGEEVARRVVFTDVAPKHMHIKRGRIADAFLDTTECNAHTTAVDILWSGTPVLTWPRHEHKLCSRVAASVACATGHGRAMVVSSADEYVERAVEWATKASHEYTYDCPLPAPARPPILDPDPRTGYVKHRICHGPTMDIRLQLFMARDRSRLFDTLRWTRNLERGYAEAWRRWVTGEDEVDDDEPGEPQYVEKTADDTRALDKPTRRKALWSRRIEQRIADELAAAASQRRPVYAPRGGSIWVLDEDDGMPSQTWVREMLSW
ncbi:UDP-N-acetylglucosaminyltransferase [Coemansia mojavensis]|nr:UDP-N-acetylglucosaminyltransferase [Coemansia mojavensis]